VRVAHGAHEERLEGHQDRLGVVAAGVALLADRDETGQDEQTVQTGPIAHQPRGQEGHENRQTGGDFRGRADHQEETEGPPQRSRSTEQRFVRACLIVVVT